MLSRIRRSTLSEDLAIHASYTPDPRGANCMTCLKLVDKETIDPGQQLNFPEREKVPEWEAYWDKCDAYRARGMEYTGRPPTAPFPKLVGGDVQGQDFLVLVLECHGASEEVRIEMGSREWQVQDAARKVKRMGYFRPDTFSGVQLHGVANTVREDEDPERKPLVVVPG